MRISFLKSRKPVNWHKNGEYPKMVILFVFRVLYENPTQNRETIRHMHGGVHCPNQLSAHLPLKPIVVAFVCVWSSHRIRIARRGFICAEKAASSRISVAHASTKTDLKPHKNNWVHCTPFGSLPLQRSALIKWMESREHRFSVYNLIRYDKKPAGDFADLLNTSLKRRGVSVLDVNRANIFISIFDGSKNTRKVQKCFLGRST